MANLKDFSCDQCSKKQRCKKPCPPVEWYANQDQVEPGREKTIAPESIGIRQFPVWPKSLSQDETVFQLYFFDRKPPDEIAITLYIHRSTVYRAIKRAKDNWKKSLQNS